MSRVHRVSHEYVLLMLRYNPETGELCWSERAPSQRRGKIAGFVSWNGYRRIVLSGENIFVHRLVWFYVHNRWPSHLLDHRDGDRSNNRLSNLREATHSQNSSNRKVVVSSSGLKGVCFHRLTGKWQAAIKSEGRSFHIGLFSTKEEAYEAYMKEANLRHGPFANGGEKHVA